MAGEEALDTSPADAEPSLADSLANAWDEMSDDEGGGEQAAASASADTPAAAEDEPTEPDAAAQPQGEDSGDPEGDPEPQAATDEPGDEAQETDDAPIEATAHWSAEDRAAFERLPPDGQRLLLDRHRSMEADYTRKTQELAPLRKAYEPLKASAERLGITEAESVQRLVAAQQAFETSPLQATQWIANQYIQTPEQARAVIESLAQKHGLKLGEQRADNDDQDALVDPEVARLNEQVSRLSARLEQGEQSAATQQRQQAQAAVDAFREAKDESGNLKHPHFDKVRAAMGALVTSGVATDIEDAYARAVRADPELYQEQAEALVTQTKQQQTAAARKAAADAKRRALPRSGKAAPAKPKPANITDEMSQLWDSMTTA